MRVMSQIKKSLINYINLFKKQECPWCREKCISYWRKIRLQSNNWDLSRYRKRECPECKKKLKLKTPLKAKIFTAIVEILLLVCLFLTIVGYIHSTFKFWAIFLIGYLTLYAIPVEEIVCDEENIE